MIESADKLAALGAIDALTRFNAYYTHATAYYAMVSTRRKALTLPKMPRSRKRPRQRPLPH